jgi:hypothetical protein
VLLHQALDVLRKRLALLVVIQRVLDDVQQAVFGLPLQDVKLEVDLALDVGEEVLLEEAIDFLGL